MQLASTLPAMQALQKAAAEISRNKRFIAWVSVTGSATYLLLLTGSYVTRTGASLACPAFPWCGTSVWNSLITIQILHRYTAFTVALLTLVLIVWLVTQSKIQRLASVAYGVGALVLIQFGPGMTNVWLRLPMWSRVCT